METFRDETHGELQPHGRMDNDVACRTMFFRLGAQTTLVADSRSREDL